MWGMKTTRLSIIPSRHKSDNKKCELFKMKEIVINMKPNIVRDKSDIIRIEKRFIFDLQDQSFE